MIRCNKCNMEIDDGELRRIISYALLNNGIILPHNCLGIGK